MIHVARWSPLAAAGFAVVLGSACSGADHMNQGGEEMYAALSDASQENDRHAGACDAAAFMDDMMSELARHEDRMGELTSRMDDAREHMRYGSMMSNRCSGTSFDHMSSSLTDMHSEMAAHSDRVRAASTLDDAQAECRTHTDTMREMMNGMMDDLDSMPCMGR